MRDWLLSLVIGFILVSGGSGCATTSAPPPEPPETPPAKPLTVPERYQAITQALAVQLAKAKDCGGVARVMNAWTDAHKRELGELVPALEAWEEEVGPFDARDYHKRLFPHVEVRIEAGMRCQTNQATTRAYDRFFAALGFSG